MGFRGFGHADHCRWLALALRFVVDYVCPVNEGCCDLGAHYRSLCSLLLLRGHCRKTLGIEVARQRL